VELPQTLSWIYGGLLLWEGSLGGRTGGMAREGRREGRGHSFSKARGEMTESCFLALRGWMPLALLSVKWSLVKLSTIGSAGP